MLAEAAFKKFMNTPGVRTVLDVGCGDGEHARAMALGGKTVSACTLDAGRIRDGIMFSLQVGDFMELEWSRRFDAVWCCHCLEHVENPNAFLKRIGSVLKPRGWACITVPPRKDQIVSGHVSMWNTGLLLYHMVLAGFDCRNAAIGRFGYNCSVLVNERTDVDVPFGLTLEEAKNFMPFDVRRQIGINASFRGQIEEMNWREV